MVTGSWSAKAVKEAEKEGSARVVWSGEADGFVRIPRNDEITAAITGDPAYLHITSNETIHGVEFPTTPTVPPNVPLVSDSSSDFLSRPVDIAGHGLLYAGAQKNAGPAGVTVAIIRDDLLARIPDGLPTVLDYRTYVEHGSMYNTPPVFAIYVLMLVTRWLTHEVGGLEKQLEHNREKASLVYDPNRPGCQPSEDGVRRERLVARDPGGMVAGVCAAVARGRLRSQIVIQRNVMDYLRPMEGDFEAFCPARRQRPGSAFSMR